MDEIRTSRPDEQAADQGIQIHLVLADGYPPSGRAKLSPAGDGPPHGVGSGGLTASVDFVGWLGLMAAVGRLVQIVDGRPRGDYRGMHR